MMHKEDPARNCVLYWGGTLTKLVSCAMSTSETSDHSVSKSFQVSSSTSSTMSIARKKSSYHVLNVSRSCNFESAYGSCFDRIQYIFAAIFPADEATFSAKSIVRGVSAAVHTWTVSILSIVKYKHCLFGVRWNRGIGRLRCGCLEAHPIFLDLYCSCINLPGQTRNYGSAR